MKICVQKVDIGKNEEYIGCISFISCNMPSKPRVTELTIKKMESMNKQGLRSIDIANKLGFSVSTFYLIRQAGWDMRTYTHAIGLHTPFRARYLKYAAKVKSNKTGLPVPNHHKGRVRKVAAPDLNAKAMKDALDKAQIIGILMDKVNIIAEEVALAAIHEMSFIDFIKIKYFNHE